MYERNAPARVIASASCRGARCVPKRARRNPRSTSQPQRSTKISKLTHFLPSTAFSLHDRLRCLRRVSLERNKDPHTQTKYPKCCTTWYPQRRRASLTFALGRQPQPPHSCTLPTCDGYMYGGRQSRLTTHPNRCVALWCTWIISTKHRGVLGNLKLNNKTQRYRHTQICNFLTNQYRIKLTMQRICRLIRGRVVETDRRRQTPCWSLCIKKRYVRTCKTMIKNES